MKNRASLATTTVLLVASGLLLTVIQAPIDWSSLAWVGYVPFAVACSPRVKLRPLVWLSLAVGFLYWLCNVYWVAPITRIGWVAMSFYLAWFWPLLAIAVRFCRGKGIPLFVALPVLVAGAERLHGFPMGGFYWRFLGHSQYANLVVIQIADIFGAAGVSFVVAMVNGLLADGVVFALSRRSRRRWTGRHSPPYGLLAEAVVTVVVVVTAILYGQWRVRQTAGCLEQGPRVAALQSNVPISVKRSFKASEDIFNELMEESRAAAAAGAELIVWPETMVQGYLQPRLWRRIPDSNWVQDESFYSALADHAKGTAYILVGAYGGEVLRDPLGREYFGQYNSCYMYRPDGTIAPQRYDKIHLVLFGEYIPFRRSLPWVFEQLKRFLPEGYNPDYSLEHGTNYTIFEMEPSRHFAVIICYEDTIPYVGRNFTLDDAGRKRIDWLVNISNDGWFVRFKQGPNRVIPSSELPQHAAICAFRAVENRLPILRSVNTGISCLIESTGRIRDGYLAASDGFPTEAMDRTGLTGWFLDQMPIDTRVSFYSRHGEWFANCLTAAFVAAVISPLGARLVRRRRPKTNR